MDQNIKQWIESTLIDWFKSHGLVQSPVFIVEFAKNKSHGDLACNIALVLSKHLKQKPYDIAQAIVEQLNDHLIAEVRHIEIAGPGFINIFLNDTQRYQGLIDALNEREQYGYAAPNTSKKQKILVEFVSANPTGPLHVGHGRGAAYGASLTALLKAAGHDVDSEYYVNDAGRQMMILAVSVWLRYLGCKTLPSNAYQGAYIKDIAQKLRQTYADTYQHDVDRVLAKCGQDEAEGGDKEKYIDAVIAQGKLLLGANLFAQLQTFSLTEILQEIQQDLDEFGVSFDQWFSEQNLIDEKCIDDLIERLRQKDLLYEQDGAWWFKSTQFGDEKDRVVVRENGIKTYFASDIAYHTNKLDRGYDTLINIWGADHHGYVPRVKSALKALDYDADRLKILLVQFAALYRGQEKLPMTTRGGQFVTLRLLRDEVGNDAARFFYAVRKPEQHMVFDLQLAVEKSNENPMYYIQYAHARICSLQEKLLKVEPSWRVTVPNDAQMSLLNSDIEQALLMQIRRFPQLIERYALQLEVHNLAHLLREVATNVHSYYNATPILVEDVAQRNSRMALLLGVRWVLSNGLNILGVKPLEKM